MKNINHFLTVSLAGLSIFLFILIVSCEDGSLLSETTQNSHTVNPTRNNAQLLEMKKPLFGTSTCADEESRSRCDQNHDGICDCNVEGCNLYCSRLLEFILTHRGRNCPEINGCVPISLDQLIIETTVHDPEQLLSDIRTKNGEIFARGYLVEFDQEQQLATVGYEVHNSNLANENLFIHFDTNYINTKGEFTELEMVSAEIEAGHFLK